MLPKPERTSAMEMSSRIRSKCGLSSASIFSLSDPKNHFMEDGISQGYGT